jgi:hypothetical protein
MDKGEERGRKIARMVSDLTIQFKLDWIQIMGNASDISRIVREDDEKVQAHNKHVDARKGVGLFAKHRTSMSEHANALSDFMLHAVDLYAKEKLGDQMENTIAISAMSFVLREIVVEAASSMRMAALKAGEPLRNIPTEERLIMIVAVCALMTRDHDAAQDNDNGPDPATEAEEK